MSKPNYSNYDFPQVLKSSHQKQVDALRTVPVNNIIDTHFTRAIPFYNVDNSVERVKFYLDKTRQQFKIDFAGKTTGSLNGTTFFVNSGGNRQKYYVLFTDGTAIDPAYPGFKKIEVLLLANDQPPIIAQKTAIELIMTKDFQSETRPGSNQITITCVDLGLTDDLLDVDSLLGLTTIYVGETELIKDVNIEQIADTRIVYNPLHKHFEYLNVQSLALTDSNGDEITSTLVEEKQALDVNVVNGLNGPAIQAKVALTSASTFRVRAGSQELENRRVITLQPLDGLIWVFFGNGTTTPSAADVKNIGFPQPKGSLRTYEAPENQPIFIVADTGTVDVRYVERK